MSDPTELDRLDPAPCIRQDPPARPSRRRQGPQEIAVRKDLRRMPQDLRAGAVAAAALTLARQMDQIAMTPRDFAGLARELRMCMTQLREWNPAGEMGDATDAARDRMEGTRQLYAVDLSCKSHPAAGVAGAGISFCSIPRRGSRLRLCPCSLPPPAWNCRMAHGSQAR